MATDFFERQAAARRSTAWLLGVFGLAVVALVGVMFFVSWAAVSAQKSSKHGSFSSAADPQSLQLPLGVAAGTLALVGGGSLYKVASLRAGGGHGVAEGLGGRRLLHDTARTPAEKRLLNVVDEMAIASGTPSPPVFLMDEAGINAFAAGYSPSDAVIGVTRGCVETLSRDELQGVIAHEFSHILNGDMRMSIRLIGVLHGILLLGLIGRLVLESVFHSGAHYDSRRSDSEGSGKGGGVIAILVIGVVLLVIGSIGSLMGGLIKAAVSRQREYLADASAVQFTRNPLGISGALKRILASTSGARLKHPRAAELSHMYFAEGVWEGFTSMMATHPPLPKRIRAIEPSWDGSLPKPLSAGQQSPEVPRSPEGSAEFAGASQAVADVTVHELDQAVDQIGDPLEAHRVYAAQLIGDLPAEIRDAVGNPSTARAVVYGLLLDADPEVRAKQRAALGETADPYVVYFLFNKLLDSIDSLEPRHRLPLIDLSLPSLAAMSFPQYQRFCRSFRALVLADDRLSLFEWTLSQVLLRHLRPHYERVRSPRIRHSNLYSLAKECGVLLSTLAYACSDVETTAAGYSVGRTLLKEAPPEVLPREACRLDDLRAALAEIEGVAAHHRGRIVDAAAAVICADGRVEVAEAELLRGIADLLDCPMPPLLPGQTVVS